MNGSAGISFNPADQWNLKVNLSSGYRAPNLAELSSNGVHEGTFRYEIG
jgi:iron complex outermembrane receptor protein